MDLKKRLTFFTRLIRILVYIYLVVQYIQVRNEYNAALMIPVIVALGTFYILMDFIIFRVPEERFRITSLGLMCFEMLLVSLLIS